MTIIGPKLDLTPDILYPPGDYYSNEPPLESTIHLRQIFILWYSLEEFLSNRNDFFAAGNLTIFYSSNQLKSEEFAENAVLGSPQVEQFSKTRGPDFFVVLGCEKKERKSWVVWEEEGKYPNVIVEILSSSTASTDKNLKKEIYQNTFRTPNYFWFDPYTYELAGFHLVDGQYQPITPNEQGYLWSEQLELYLGLNEEKLRFFTPGGHLLPTPEEKAISAKQEATQAKQEATQAKQEATQAKQEATQAKQEATQAKQEVELLAAKLRELNIDPNTLSKNS